MRIVLIAVLIGACHNSDSPGPDTAIDPNRVYVAASAAAGGDGTISAPLSTIAQGIALAIQRPPSVVYVRAGTYAESVVMASGVSVYGGFDEAWNPSDSSVTEIVGGIPAVAFNDTAALTSLETVSITSADAHAPGESSIAIAIDHATDVRLRQVTLHPGAGAAGIDGVAGVTGAAGAPGSFGAPGCEDSGGFCDTCGTPSAGSGGGSPCGHLGGSGGVPGKSNGTGGPGKVGRGSTAAPGAGGRGGHNGDGTPGSDGAPGANGTSGTGGAEVGSFLGVVYTPAYGGDTSDGSDGDGGGGGGGGGGGTSGCDSYGSSGGGGGGGGCHGTAGTSGTGGGGSFGIVAADSHVVVEASTIVAGAGGPGGAAGIAGSGGKGGAGARGGLHGSSQDDGGMGGAGGRGGNGGAGGQGGGGGGGPSAALVCVGSAIVEIRSTTLSASSGGPGGTSTGTPGMTGVSTRAIGCALF